MRILAMLAVMVAVTGCWRGGGGEREPVAPARPVKAQAERNLAIMAMFRDRMCECSNRPCLDGVQAAMADWVERRMAEPQVSSPPPTEETMARITEVGLSMSECASRLITTHAAR